MNRIQTRARSALTERKLRSKTTNDPLFGRASANTARGRRIIDLPGYGYAEASPAERAQWTSLIDFLPERASLKGLFLIVDIRRGLTPQDEQLFEWAASAGWQVHVLLTKSDKLNQRDRAAALKATQSVLREKMTAQVFSALDKTGVQTAQKRLIEMLSN